jgi:molybdate transport system substrate-binding protein
VQGENIAQAYQFVATGNAAFGFVALSQVAAPATNPPPGGEGPKIAQGSGWIVPADLHAPIRQDAVLLRAGAANVAATAFLQYLRGNAARAILRDAGYGT